MTIQPIEAPALLKLDKLSDDEARLVGQLAEKLDRHAGANKTKLGFYTGEYLARQFGISIPPTMKGVKTPVGWAGTAVDVVEERLEFQGWASEDGDDLGLKSVYKSNTLDVEAPLLHVDSLIYGTSFAVVGSGESDEPNPLVTVHSPSTMTAVWDRARRRVTDALATTGTDPDDKVSARSLYRRGETVSVEKVRGAWVVTNRDEHELNRVPVVQYENRGRTDVHGRSEITHAVRYLVEHATRTMLGMEVSREFYNAPKIAGLNMTEAMFEDEDGNTVSQWDAIMGRILFAPPNEPGEHEPKIQTIPAASPAPYIDEVQLCANMLAAECGFPPSYLGVHTANPASADAIRALEARLVKRVERRQKQLGRSWMEVAKLALLVRDGAIDPRIELVEPQWQDASTPTRAANADAAMKLVSVGILPADSQVTMDWVGLSPFQQATIKNERRTADAAKLLAGMAGGNGAVVPVIGVSDGDPA